MSVQSVIERLPREGHKPFAALTRYAVLGQNRSYQKVAAELGVSPRIVQRWANQWTWQIRVAQWDDAVAAQAMRLASDSYAADIRDFQKRYGNIGKAMFSTVAAMLVQVRERIDAPGFLDDVGPRALTIAAQALQLSSQLEAYCLNLEKVMQLVDETPTDAQANTPPPPPAANWYGGTRPTED